MGSKRIDFATLLDHFAGRPEAGLDDQPGSALADQAKRLVETGRRALAAPRPGKRLLKRARRIFLEHRAPPKTSLLRMVLDSLLTPAPAVRAEAQAAEQRFLRFEGDVVVDLQVSPKSGSRVELRGQVTPADAATQVFLHAGKRTIRTQVHGDGTFLMRSVPRGEVDLVVGGARIAGLVL